MYILTFIILVVISAQKVFGLDVTVTLDKECYTTGESMTITASYGGLFAINGVIWSYSGRNMQDTIVDTHCYVFQSDAGFPNNRTSYVCPPSTANNTTYQLILSSLVTDDLNKRTWSVTFQVNASLNPSFETVLPELCEVTMPETYECPGLGYGKAVDSQSKCICTWFGIFVTLVIVIGFIIGLVLGFLLPKCGKPGCRRYDNALCPTFSNKDGFHSNYKILLWSVLGCPVALGIWLVRKCDKKEPCEDEEEHDIHEQRL